MKNGSIPDHSLARTICWHRVRPRVDHPSSGPTTSKDIIDALFEVASMLIDLEHDPGELFRSGGGTPRARPWPHTENSPVFEALSDVGR